MKKKKVIILGAALGRVGSSALMGLLEKSGVDVGGKKSGLTGPSDSNKKGFFEMRTLNQFLRNIYGKYYGHEKITPTIGFVEKITNKNLNWFKKFLQEEFGNSSVIAIKGGRFLLLPFFYALRNEYEIKVIVLNRNSVDQVNSILKMWKRIKGREKISNVTYLTDRLYNWIEFVGSMRKNYSDVDYLDICFEDLMSNPLNSYSKIAKFCKITMLTSDQIKQWIDPNLVHFRTGAKNET